MKKTALAVLISILAITGVTARNDVSSRPTCAILTFNARAGVTEGEAGILSDRFTAEFEQFGQYQIITRSKVQELLEEHKFQAGTSTSAADTAVEAGRILGVRYMVFGAVGRLGGVYTVNSFLIEVETGAQIRSATIDIRDGIEALLTRGMRQNAAILLNQQQPVVQEPETPVRIDPAPAHTAPPLADGNRRIDDLRMDLILVSPGSFMMGAAKGERQSLTAREVRISRPYWIGKHEVTNREYSQFVRDYRYNDRRDADKNYQRHLRARNAADRLREHPVTWVSWSNASAFCRWLTQRERRAGRLPEGYVYRLPTSAEWEYAARGGAHSQDFMYAGSDNVDSVAWHSGNSSRGTRPVGGKQANELGIYDMSGSVWEWCNDWHQRGHGGLPDVDPAGPSRGAQRVFRGGSWGNPPNACVLAYPGLADPPTKTRGNLGFRIVLAPAL